MTNDTTTLNGALSELGETLASNITSKGVSASASDGLTTLANKVLQITGGGGSTTLFEDACDSASGLSNYGSSECVRGTDASITLSYDSTQNAYKVSGSGNYHAYVPITALKDKDEYVITMELKAFNIMFNKVGLFLDNYGDTTSYGCMFALNCYDKRFDYQQYNKNSNGTSSNTSVSSLQPDTWYKLEYTVNGSSLTGKLYTTDGTLLATKEVTLAVSNKSMGIFLFCETGSTDSTCYVRNIKAESLGGDTPTTTVIFDEDGSVDHSSTLFGSHISLRNSGTGTATYNNNGYYVLTNTKGSAEAFIEFSQLQGIYDKSFKVTARSQGTTNDRCPIGLYYYLDDNNWGGVKDEVVYVWTSAKTNGTFTENSTATGNSNNVEVVSEFIFDVDENTLTVNDYVGDVLKGTKSMTVPVTLNSNVKWGTTTTWSNNTSRNLYEIKAEYTGVAPTPVSPCAEYIAEIDSAIEYINGSGS